MMLQELRTDQQRRWQTGEHVSVEAYLRRYPELASDVETLSDLILSEMLLREAAGKRAPLEDYLQRYPQCAGRLLQRYRADLATAMPGEMSTAARSGTIPPTMDFSPPLPPAPTIGADPGMTLNVSPSPNMETIQLDEAGQLAAQEKAFQDGVPKIPGYTILSELGRGGMGVVYRALQISAGRDVALKIVRSDVLDTLPLATRNSTLQRFRHEAHAAAKLEHDNLVPVYDVGEVGSLRYYAMRFVDGISLYDMLRNAALDGQTAAKFIEAIARGLHYAHEQGVLHRDLKPHNIIVERKSGRPMLTDFGLAKFLEHRDELTHVGDVMGTPSYMSPEQARDSGRVGPLADVYSLGATLYHVLTSRPPFQAAMTAETIRQVLDDEPVAPRRLNPAIDGDLETICLKCLQKEPARRYDSALALAEDLQRYMKHESIRARPASWPERAWRWCRRNPKLAGAIAVAAFFAVFTVLSSTVGYVQVKAGKARSDSLLKQALVVVDDLFTRISEDELLNQPGMQPLRKDLLERALKHYQHFLAESGDDPTIQDAIAAAHYRVGAISMEMGDDEVAEKELGLAKVQQEKLLAADRMNRQRVDALGDTLNILARLMMNRTEWSEAERFYSQCESLRSQLAQLDEGDLNWQRKLASVRMNLGLAETKLPDRQEQGRRHMLDAQERRLAILRKDPEFTRARRDLAMGYFNIANYDSLAFYKSPEPEKAQGVIDSLREAIKYFDQLVAADPESLTNLYYLSLANRLLGGILAETGDTGEAVKAFEAAKQPMTSLAVGNPKIELYQSELAMLCQNQGDLYRQQKNYPSARRELGQTKVILERLLKNDPKRVDFRTDLGGTLGALGQVERLDGDLPQAQNTLGEAIALLEQLLAEFPGDLSLIKWLDEARQDLALARQPDESASAPPNDDPR